MFEAPDNIKSFRDATLNLEQLPKCILAPMVSYSDLCWRMFVRRYGISVCYSPMMSCMQFCKSEIYRKTNFQTNSTDRPLIVQFCGNSPSYFASAARLVEPYCDGIDINLGCPQDIARRGRYGAYLQNDINLIEDIIRELKKSVRVPVSCKIRVLETEEATIEYVRRIRDAGIDMVAVHGRTIKQKGSETGLANWEMIKKIKETITDIPIIANGNILYKENIDKCLEFTKADSVMIAESMLYNPTMCHSEDPHPLIVDVVKHYVSLCKDIYNDMGTLAGTEIEPYNPLFYKGKILSAYKRIFIKSVKNHLLKLYRPCLELYIDDRNRILNAQSFEDVLDASQKMSETLEEIHSRHRESDKVMYKKTEDIDTIDSRTYKSIPHWRTQPYIRKNIASQLNTSI